jgi:hypothetical protein
MSEPHPAAAKQRLAASANSARYKGTEIIDKTPGAAAAYRQRRQKLVPGMEPLWKG